MKAAFQLSLHVLDHLQQCRSHPSRLKDSDSNMLLFLFLFGLALGGEFTADDHSMMIQCGGCPPFWFSFNDRCYKYVATPQSWADAELHCVSQGGNLVSIHSLMEQNFTSALIKSFDFSERPTWIGLSDTHKEGSWMWSDGSPVTFVYWIAGEPNNLGGHENCAHINLSTHRKWNDGRCSASFPSICASRISCIL